MFELVIFFFFAAVAVIGALTVVLHPNQVVGAISLVLSFFALAVMYVLLGAPFMAALQVIIYAGAIMVLFLFVIMLLNVERDEIVVSRPVQRFLGYTAGSAFGLTVSYYLLKAAVIEAPEGSIFLSDARSVGMRLFEAYIFPFEMVSILLLAAIVGALLLTQRDVRRDATGGGETV
ncbi:MAG TPA: NADH-quinone oxidoreductase subunit J [Thermoanaerobaculia bacterium]|nr:NADH-quinone oxidoreductase subunit J [Thermoanaerobaculia bacterium]